MRYECEDFQSQIDEVLEAIRWFGSNYNMSAFFEKKKGGAKRNLGIYLSAFKQIKFIWTREF